MEFRRHLLTTTALVAIGLIHPHTLQAQGVSQGAGPQGGVVTAGSAAISQGPNQTQITQSSAKTIVEWKRFDVAPSSTVQFIQPGKDAIALNRVREGDASRIEGALNANGQVYLVNPNGVLIGPGGRINASGFVASTHDMRDQDFLAGRMDFSVTSPNAAAKLRNEGVITATQGGYAVLAGSRVENAGVIAASVGKVGLAGGDAVALDVVGDRLLQFQVTRPVQRDPGGTILSNTGALSAPGGVVTMSAQAARTVVRDVINTTGLVEANAATIDGGRVVIHGGVSGIVQIGGRVSAGSKAGKGGQVDVRGEKVGLMDGARIDVSGATGGGTVLVGGDWQGKGVDGKPAADNAQFAYVAPSASINADAAMAGDGGKVVVWAEDTTRFHGSVSARGGILSGDGGKAETSGKRALDIGSAATVTMNPRAPDARAGSWLLDPIDITIASSGAGLLPGIFAPLMSTTIAASTISAGLMSADVTLSTSTSGLGNGDITFKSGTISYSGATKRTLTFKAVRDIDIQSGAAIDFSGAAHDIVLNSGATATSQAAVDGNVRLAGATITTTGGTIQIAGGVNGMFASQSIATTDGVLISVASVLDAGAGAISIMGATKSTLGVTHGVSVSGSTLNAQFLSLKGYGNSSKAESGNGALIDNARLTGLSAITIEGDRRQGKGDNIGLQNGTTLQALGGVVTLNGASTTGVSGSGVSIANAQILVGGGQANLTGAGALTSTVANSSGVFVSGSVVTATDAGMISIIGTRGGGASSNNIFVTSGSQIKAENGAITLTGTSAAGGGGVENNGILLKSATLTTVGGAISLSGTGAALTSAGQDGVAIESGQIQSASGAVTLTGVTSSSAGVSSQGVAVAFASTVTTGGGISITGTGNSVNADNSGVLLYGASTLSTTGAGSISITSLAGPTVNSIQVNSGANLIKAGGDLTLKADSITVNAGGTIMGSGALTILPITLSKSMSVNEGSATDIALNSAAWAKFGTGFSSYTFGAVGGTGNVLLGALTSSGPINVRGASLGIGGDLIVTTNGDITFKGDQVSVSANVSNLGTGGVTLLANEAGTAAYGGGIYVLKNITTAAGDIKLVGRTSATLPNNGVEIQGTIAAGGAGAISIAGARGYSTTLSTTNILMTAASRLSTVSGSITLDGSFTGNGGHSASFGVNIKGGSTIASTGGGNIAITGARANNENAHNVRIEGLGTSVSTTGAGTISIIGTDTTNLAGGYSFGVLVDFGAVIASDAGAITIKGKGAPSAQAGQMGVAIFGDDSVSPSLGTTVKTNTGTITLIGDGGTKGLTDYSEGVGIDRNSQVLGLAGGSSIVINATANPASGAAAVRLGGALQGGTVAVTGGGTLSIDAAGKLWAAKNSMIGTATHTGALSITAKSLEIDATSGLNGAGALTIRPLDNATSVGIGGGAGDMQLSSTILAGAAGFSSITIGRDATTAQTTIGGMTLAAGATIWGGDIVLAGGTINYVGPSAQTLTLRANRHIVASTGANISSSNGPLNVVLNSGASATTQAALVGGVRLEGSSISTKGGAISIVGGVGGTLAASGDLNYAGGQDMQGRGVYVSSSTLDSGGGAITVRGAGSLAGSGPFYPLGVQFSQSKIASSGDVTITGAGGAVGGVGDAGVRLDTSTIALTGAGAITINGARGGGSYASANIDVGASLISTENGAITLNGLSKLGSWGEGVGIDGAISTVNGAITITGTGAEAAGGSYPKGVRLGGGGSIKATGSGSITVVGTRGVTTALGSAENIDLNASSTISTNTGSIMLDGSATAGGSSSGAGVVVRPFATVSTTGGAISIKGYSGYESGVYLDNNSQILAGAAGAIDIQAKSGGANSHFRAWGTIATAGGVLGVSAFNAQTAAGTKLDAGAGTMALRPVASNQAPGSFELLNFVTASTVEIGGPDLLAALGIPANFKAKANLSIVTNSGDIYFAGAVDALTAGVQSLKIKSTSGVAHFAGNVGSNAAFSTIDINGAASFGAVTVKTAGTQNFAGPVVLSGPGTTSFSTSNAALTFGSKLDGPGALAVDTGTGLYTAVGPVGGTTALGSVSVNGDLSLGGTVLTVGGQTYAGAFKLSATNTLLETQAGDIQILSGGKLTYAQANAGSLVLKAARDIVIDGGQIVSIGGKLDVTLNASKAAATQAGVTGGVLINNGTISTTGGSLLIGAGVGAAFAASGSGAMSDLGLSSRSGVSLVGSTIDLGAGALTARGISTTGLLNGQGIEIKNSKAAAAGGIDLTGAGSQFSTATAYGVAVNYGSELNGGAGGLKITGTGGGSTSAVAVGVGISDTKATFGAGGLTIVGAAGTNSAAASNRGVELTGTTSITGSGVTKITGAGGSQSSGHGVYVAGATIATSGANDVSITGLRGSGQSSRNILIATGGMVQTVGGALTLNGAASSGGGGVNNQGVQIQGGVATATGLISITGAGAASGDGVDVSGVIGATGAGGSILLRGVGSGVWSDIVLSGANLSTTTGDVTYQAKWINLASPSTTTTGAGTIRLQSPAAADSIVVGGADAKLGPTSAFLSTLNGAVEIGSATQTGSITVAANTVLKNATTFRTGSGAIGFLGAVDGQNAGGQSLKVQTPGGSVNFAGSVGGSTAFAAVDVSGPARFGAGMVASIGSQSYAGAVSVNSGTIVFSTTNAPVIFGSTLDGPGGIDVRSGTGSVGFVGAVGATTALAGLLIPMSPSTPTLTPVGPPVVTPTQASVPTVATTASVPTIASVQTLAPTTATVASVSTIASTPTVASGQSVASAAAVAALPTLAVPGQAVTSAGATALLANTAVKEILSSASGQGVQSLPPALQAAISTIVVEEVGKLLTIVGGGVSTGSAPVATATPSQEGGKEGGQEDNKSGSGQPAQAKVPTASGASGPAPAFATVGPNFNAASLLSSVTSAAPPVPPPAPPPSASTAAPGAPPPGVVGKAGGTTGAVFAPPAPASVAPAIAGAAPPIQRERTGLGGAPPVDEGQNVLPGVLKSFGGQGGLAGARAPAALPFTVPLQNEALRD